jgi:hypothetical protein
MKTIKNNEIPQEVFNNNLKGLINRFYKILPLKESGEPSLDVYLQSFQSDLIGSKNLILALNNDGQFLNLISTLQFLIDNDCDLKTVKREVFKSIKICEKLNEKYLKGGVDDG